MMEEARQVEMEAFVIDWLDDRRKEKGMTVEEWATKVYPGIPSARQRLQHLRKPQGANGKRKRLLYSEFIQMARALDISPAEVVTITSQAFDEIKI